MAKEIVATLIALVMTGVNLAAVGLAVVGARAGGSDRPVRLESR
jgi:hypothetical protein